MVGALSFWDKFNALFLDFSEWDCQDFISSQVGNVKYQVSAINNLKIKSHASFTFPFYCPSTLHFPLNDQLCMYGTFSLNTFELQREPRAAVTQLNFGISLSLNDVQFVVCCHWERRVWESFTNDHIAK